METNQVKLLLEVWVENAYAEEPQLRPHAFRATVESEDGRVVNGSIAVSGEDFNDPQKREVIRVEMMKLLRRGLYGKR